MQIWLEWEFKALLQSTSRVNLGFPLLYACTNSRVLHLWNRMCPHLRVEENFRAEEALIADVNVEGTVGEGVNSSVQFDPLSWIRVVLCELLHYVRTDVTSNITTQLS
uniref:Uncharacterized protein n=1 Tax=Oryzias latipes TaxID=8090 RepID=A0A3P9KKJ0_ORYLA